MKAWILFSSLTLLLFGGCTKPKDFAPNSLEKFIFNGAIETTSDDFTGMEGSTFTADFINGGQFLVKSPSGEETTAGNYNYKKLGPKNAHLELNPKTGEGTDKIQEIHLTFTSNKSGTFKGELTQGGKGVQAGSFTLSPE